MKSPWSFVPLLGRVSSRVPLRECPEAAQTLQRQPVVGQQALHDPSPHAGVIGLPSRLSCRCNCRVCHGEFAAGHRFVRGKSPTFYLTNLHGSTQRTVLGLCAPSNCPLFSPSRTPQRDGVQVAWRQQTRLRWDVTD